MTKVCLLLVACSFLVTVLCDGNTHCEIWGKQFGEGETITNKEKCIKATCMNAKTNSVDTLGCPVYRIRYPCRLTEMDLSKDYPDCCPQVVCPNKDEANLN